MTVVDVDEIATRVSVTELLSIPNGSAAVGVDRSAGQLEEARREAGPAVGFVDGDLAQLDQLAGAGAFGDAPFGAPSASVTPCPTSSSAACATVALRAANSRW